MRNSCSFMIIRVKKERNLGKLLYLCTVKAAIKRAKSREHAFELFRAEARSNALDLCRLLLKGRKKFKSKQRQLWKQ